MMTRMILKKTGIAIHVGKQMFVICEKKSFLKLKMFHSKINHTCKLDLTPLLWSPLLSRPSPLMRRPYL